jgi:3'-phosphoadenosine 5'-phosphosulfate sulfotransferase (PAPS reductase)/FAD synthetase
MKRHEKMVLVVNMSGGKDSCYMLLQLCQKYPHIPKVAVMADTGFEHVKPISAEAFARQVCTQLGVPLFVVQSIFEDGSRKTVLELWEKRGMFSSKANRNCTSDTKRDPIDKWVRQQSKPGCLLHGKIVINCVGIRAQESTDRAEAKPLTFYKRNSKAGRIIWTWLPIHKATLTQVLDGLAAAGIPLHPVYSYRGNGGYLTRLSCRVCIFSTKADILAIYRNDREAFDIISNLEQKIGHTMRSDRLSLLDIVRGQVDINQVNDQEVDALPCAA